MCRLKVTISSRIFNIFPLTLIYTDCQLRFLECLFHQVSAVVTLPFDVVKTHKQIELGEMELLKEKRSTSTFSLMRDLYQDRGMRGLFAGIVPRISKVAPACAIMISIYEYGKAYFRKKNAVKSSNL